MINFDKIGLFKIKDFPYFRILLNTNPYCQPTEGVLCQIYGIELT